MQQRTLDVLKNFATINQGLLFEPGSRLRTMAMATNIYATASIPDTIPRGFAIYDLNEFLTVLNLFDGYELEYNTDHILIKSGSTKIKYVYSSPAVLTPLPDSDPKLEGELFSFDLSQADLSRIMKASSILGLKDLSIRSTALTCYNVGVAGNTVDIDVAAVEGTGTDKMAVIKIELMKMLPGDYEVRVFERAVQFRNKVDTNLVYTVAVEVVQ